MELKEAIEELKEYIKVDIEYRGKTSDGSDFDEFCDKHIEAIETVLQTLEEYQKQMDLDYVDENYISKDKIKEKIEEQTKRIDKLLEDMVDKSTGCINVSYLSKKEKEEVIAKRNSLIVQRATLQQVKEELLKGE